MIVHNSTPEDLKITSRDLAFGRSAPTPRHWLGGDAIATAFYNALSASFPQGERFFMDSVRNFKSKADPKLQQQIVAFTTQEALHTREHVFFNQQIAGAGYDAVDVPALTRKKIPLMLAGMAHSVSVAEQALSFMLSLAKRSAELDALVRGGRWLDRFNMLPGDLFGKTVLIVGFGRIGSRLARRCWAMEMTVLVYDPYVPAHTIRAAQHEPVDALDAAVARADFISLHCPKTPQTLRLFDSRRIGRMKKSAFLVNTARGGIVDEMALHAALVSGTIAGAALDVFEREPPAADNPLLKLPNLFAAPHVAGVTREASDRMAVATVQNLLDVLDGRPNPDHVVNKEVLG